MEPDDGECEPNRGGIGRGFLIGIVFGVLVWWGIYKLVASLIE